MRFNPFEEKPMPLDRLFMDWDKLYPKPYHLGTVHPYTKVRIVLMNGTESKPSGSAINSAVTVRIMIFGANWL